MIFFYQKPSPVAGEGFLHIKTCQVFKNLTGLFTKWLAADGSTSFQNQNGLLLCAARHFKIKMACCYAQHVISKSKWLAADGSTSFQNQNGLLRIAARHFKIKMACC
jgi:hypothetical protein